MLVFTTSSVYRRLSHLHRRTLKFMGVPRQGTEAVIFCCCSEAVVTQNRVVI
jgi:hypothetical protein